MSGRSRNRPGVSGTGIVLEVLSGDSFIIQGSAVGGGPAPKKQLSLSGISAPLLSRSRRTEDKPFAFHAREYLRKKILGKIVQFQINAAGVSQSSDSDRLTREYSDCSIAGQSLAEYMVAGGYATVKVPSAESKIYPEKQALLDLQTRAEEMGLGIHQKDIDEEDFVRDVDWQVDGYSFFRANKGIPLPGIIDKIIDGSTYRIELFGANIKSHSMITLYLAGLTCPNLPLPYSVQKSIYDRRVADGEDNVTQPQDEEPEPFAVEAKEYVAKRLLGRDVRVLLQSSDKYGSLFGTVLFPRGNISPKLIEEGFAKVCRWSASLTATPQDLDNAERKAVAMRSRIYATYTPSKESKQVAEPYTIKQILSGDRVVARNAKGEDSTFFLASILAPRQGNRSRGIPDKPYSFEAKELLRSRLIGRKVKLVTEYTQSATAGASSGDLRTFVSLFRDKENFNMLLVRMGYAKVTPHRRIEARASNYEALLEAESDAERRRVGIHSSKAYGGRYITDLTIRRRRRGVEVEDVEEEDMGAGRTIPARGYLDTFAMEKSLAGVVEYVFSGTRIKVFLPKHNCMISLNLAHVRSPAREVDGKVNEFANTGKLFVAELLTQQDVRISIEGLDKGDNFIGNLYFNKKNLALELVNQGMATVYEPSARRAGEEGEALLDACDRAKNNQTGLWKDFDPSSVVAEEPETQSVGVKLGEELAVVVTELADISNFYVQFPKDPNVARVNDALDAFNAENEAPDETTYVPAKRGAICAGYFAADSAWYRVRFEGGRNGELRVLFIDFGNRDVLSDTHLRELPEEAAAFPALAQAASLAGLRSPVETSDYYYDCGNYFNNLVFERDLVGKILNVSRDRKYEMVLYDSKAPEVSINATVATNGFGRLVAPRLVRGNLVQTLHESLTPLVAAAKEGHLGMYEYGDADDDGDEEQSRWGEGRAPGMKQRQAREADKAARRNK